MEQNPFSNKKKSSRGWLLLRFLKVISVPVLEAFIGYILMMANILLFISLVLFPSYFASSPPSPYFLLHVFVVFVVVLLTYFDYRYQKKKYGYGPRRFLKEMFLWKVRWYFGKNEFNRTFHDDRFNK